MTEERNQLIREAQNLSTPPERLAQLAAGDDEASTAAAENPSTPEKALLLLSKNGKARVWVALLQNPALPESCFMALFERKIRALQRLLAACPRTPAALLVRLGSSGHKEVLIAVAQNPSTSANTLEGLSGHRFTGVYRAAQRNPQSPFYVDGPPQQRWTRNTNPGNAYRGVPMPLLVLNRLVSLRYPMFRRMAAQNIGLSPELMITLCNDVDVWVRMSLAANVKLSQEAAQLLLKDSNPAVQSALRANKSLDLPAEPKRRGKPK